MKSTLLVLAAGLGTRFGGAKQMAPVGPSGELVMDYSIYDALQAGFDKLVFVIRRDMESDFRKAVGNKFKNRIEVAYAFQELDQATAGFRAPPARKKPWGTGHAVLAAQEIIHEPFAVINADDFYGRQGFRLLADFLKTTPRSGTPEYALVGFTLRNTLSAHGSVSRGVCHCDNDHYLQRVEELTRVEKDGAGAIHRDAQGRVTRLTGDEWVSLNLWGFHPSFFQHLQDSFLRFLKERGQEDQSEFFLPAVVDHLIRKNQTRVRLLPSPDTWFGVTHPEDNNHVVQSIRRLVVRGVYPSPLWP